MESRVFQKYQRELYSLVFEKNDLSKELSDLESEDIQMLQSGIMYYRLASILYRKSASLGTSIEKTISGQKKYSVVFEKLSEKYFEYYELRKKYFYYKNLSKDNPDRSKRYKEECGKIKSRLFKLKQNITAFRHSNNLRNFWVESIIGKSIFSVSFDEEYSGIGCKKRDFVNDSVVDPAIDFCLASSIEFDDCSRLIKNVMKKFRGEEITDYVSEKRIRTRSNSTKSENGPTFISWTEQDEINYQHALKWEKEEAERAERERKLDIAFKKYLTEQNLPVLEIPKYANLDDLADLRREESELINYRTALLSFYNSLSFYVPAKERVEENDLDRVPGESYTRVVSPEVRAHYEFVDSDLAHLASFRLQDCSDRLKYIKGVMLKLSSQRTKVDVVPKKGNDEVGEDDRRLGVAFNFAEERFYGLSKLRQVISRASGEYKRFQQLMQSYKNGESVDFNEVNAMFRGGRK